MERDMNILHAHCVMEDGIWIKNLEIRNGIITGVYANDRQISECSNVIDAEEYFVFPGMIDTHVHIRGGKFSYREDFFSGSQAAVSAGVTTILEMPGCAKPAANEENFLERIAEVKKEGAINFGMYGAAGHDNLEEIPKLAALGAIGFKTFQMAPVLGRETEFYGMCAETYEDMVNVMAEVKKTGLTLTVHCENQNVIDQLVPEMKKTYSKSLRGFIDSRPPLAEIKSVELTIEAAKKTGCRTIIAHVSSPESVRKIMEARALGYEIYAETCVHYLYFDKEEMIPYGVFGRMKPPFRTRKEVDELVMLYHEGAFDMTGSDHAPYTMEEKQKNGDDVWNSVDGLYGLEMSLPLLLNLVAQGKLELTDIAHTFSRKAAEIFRIPGKGTIAVGYDADFVMVKKNEIPVILHKEDLKCKCKEAAVIYEGIPMEYSIGKTIIAGMVVYDDGNVQLQKGSSRIVHY